MAAPTRLARLRSLVDARTTFDYAKLYDRLAARTSSDSDVVGGGDFDHFGRLELAILLDAGLRPTDTLVDFGCGTGRLARQVIPYLDGGEYVGIEVSAPILRRAQRTIAREHPAPRCRVEWVHNTATKFPLPDAIADVICAFSVFTHMEHEDSYRYLADGLRVVRPGGRFVFSCLPLELEFARSVFRESAAVPLAQRWRSVRNVTTSRDYMDAIASLAGWNVVAWHAGDERLFSPAGSTEPAALGQSVCVLERPQSADGDA